MFELACSSKGNPLDQTFLPVSAEAQKALFSSKICPFFSEAPPDFSFSYPARISHFGLLDPFDAFEKAYFASRRSSKKIALSELFLLDFLLTRAISEDLGNLGLGLLMRSNFKSFLSVCCEVTPSLPVDRERLVEKIVLICDGIDGSGGGGGMEFFYFIF